MLSNLPRGEDDQAVAGAELQAWHFQDARRPASVLLGDTLEQLLERDDLGGAIALEAALALATGEEEWRFQREFAGVEAGLIGSTS